MSPTAAQQQTVVWARITMTGPAPLNTAPAAFTDQVADALSRDGRSPGGIAGVRATHVRRHPDARPATTGETGRVVLCDVELTLAGSVDSDAIATALSAHVRGQDWGVARHRAAGVQVCNVQAR